VLLQFKKLHDDAIIPAYAHPHDSGFDLFACVDFTLSVGEVTPVPTGLAVILPEPLWLNDVRVTFELQVRSKSGRSLHDGFMVVNAPGTIDSTYRGEIIVLLTTIKESSHSRSFHQGEKIAQGVIAPVVTGPYVEIVETDILPPTDRGSRGFGSTGLRR